MIIFTATATLRDRRCSFYRYATPAEGRAGIGGIYDDVNICGPFNLHWKIVTPPPTAEVTASIAEPTPGGTPRQITVNATIPTYAEQATIGNCTWRVRYRPFNIALGIETGDWSEWQTLPAITGVSGTTALPQPTQQGEYMFEVQTQCGITPNGPLVTCNGTAPGSANIEYTLPALAIAPKRGQDGATTHSLGQAQSPSVQCAPTPAISQTTVNY